MTFIKVAAYHLQKFGFKAHVIQEATTSEVQSIADSTEGEKDKESNIVANGESKSENSNLVEETEEKKLDVESKEEIPEIDMKNCTDFAEGKQQYS